MGPTLPCSAQPELVGALMQVSGYWTPGGKLKIYIFAVENPFSSWIVYIYGFLKQVK